MYEEKEPQYAPLGEVASPEVINGVDLVGHSDADWNIAKRRFDSIEPLLSTPRNSGAAVRARAAECGVDVATLYRWLRQYKQLPTLSGLLDVKRSGGRGQSRLDPAQDKVIQEAIQTSYLTPQRRRARTICRLVAARCKELDIPSPHANTVRNRIAAIAPELSLGKRMGADSARQLRPLKGSFPTLDRPLAVVQIDHTPLDIILVDTEHRKPIGRPWITIAIDVYSRMVVGYHVSFEPPGSLTTALCIAHAISRKEEWLAKHNVEGEWPCAGIMRCIHVDNAKEFHSHVLKLACMEYGIDLQHRPPGRPQFGGNVERFIGTLAREIHELSGSTFSNTRAREGYDSDKNATFTLDALRLWVAKYLIEVYHQSLHSSLKTTPLSHYKAGLNRLLLTGELPRMPADLRKLELDFLPGAQRAVQRYGIQIDRLRYWHDVLRVWVNARDPKNKAKKRLFWVKRDPRDIKFVYFHDPVLKSYHRIPCRDTALPSVSLSQYKLADAMTRRDGRRQVNILVIDKALKEMEKINKNEGGKTRSARRANERRRSTPIIHEMSPAKTAATEFSRGPVLSEPGSKHPDPVSVTPFEGSED
jgi:putative transposase